MIGELSQNLNYYQLLTIKEEDEQHSDDNNTQANESEFYRHKLNDSSSGLKIQADSKSSSLNNSNKNLKSSFREKEELQIENGFDKCNSQSISPEPHLNVRELDSETALEIDRLKCRITNLESQIDLSAIHLNESKENAERFI